MISNYSGVCQIYTPLHSIHLCYPCIMVTLLSLLENVLGGHDRANLQAVIERVWRYTWRP